MLDEFRSTLITWDKATSRIYSPVTANESDENGRKLVVQIVNSGQVEDLTGATLHLYWETRDKAHDGLDVFDAVDLKKGEFELSYTTGMLSNQGVLNANLVLIDTVGRVVSERFKITVTEGIDDDAIQSENSFSSLTQALIDISNLEQNYAPRLNDLTAQLQQTEQELTAQLAQKARIDEVIRKVDGVGLNDVKPELLSAIEGGAGTNFNLLSIPRDKSVLPHKTTFLHTGKNLFNKDDVIYGYNLDHRGEPVESTDYHISGYIAVMPNTDYVRTKTYRNVFYDESQQVISAVSSNQFTTPANCAYVRIAVYFSSYKTEQLEEGTTSTEYEQYKIMMPSLHLEEDELEKYDSYPFQPKATFKTRENELILKNAIRRVEIQGADPSEKYYLSIVQNNFTTYGTGIYIKDGSGNTVANNSYLNYNFPDGIDVFELKEYANSGVTASVWVDWSKLGSGSQYTFNSYDETGLDVRTYQPNKDESGVEVKLPPIVPALIGKEINLYFDNVILSDGLEGYSIDVDCGIGMQQNERWTCIPDSSGEFELTLKVYRNGKVISQDKTVVNVTANTSGGSVTKTAIFIGDSITDAGAYTAELLNLFNDDPMSLQLLGTRGVAPNLHEGRAGWKTSNFLNDSIVNGVHNSFWNPNTNSFDFSHYMTQQGYSSVDYVNIHLGINDIFGRTDDVSSQSEADVILDGFQTMIDSIKQFSSEIKIGLMITIPPSKYQDSFGANYANNQPRWRYKRNNYIFMRSLIERFANKESENIYLIPVNVNLDTVHNMRSEEVPANSRTTRTITRQSNGVHPAYEGYYQMADVVYYWLKNQE